VEDENGSYTSLYGKKLRKIILNDPKEVPKEREKYDKHYEADIIYTNRYIIDKFTKLEKEPIRICYLDIETELKPFSELLSGKGIIQSIVCKDSFTGQYTEFFLPKFNSEMEMLLAFLYYIEVTDPDILTGWNIDNFDMPVILNRMRELKFNIETLSRLPEEKNKTYCFKDGNYWQTKIAGRIIFDLMKGYKKLTLQTSGSKESYALDFISNYEFGEGKEEYDGTLEDLYQNHPDKYLEYNKRDVELLEMIDQKLGIIDYFDEIRRYAFCRFEDVFHNSMSIDSMVLKFCNGKYVLPSRVRREPESFKGGFVKHPEKGLHKHIAVADLKSLYPNIMISCNISPETITNKNESNTTNISDTYYFTKNKKGIIPEIVETLFKERKRYKDLMNKEIYNSEEYKKYNNLQIAIKTLMNSIYGILGYYKYRLYKREVADAITLTAREIINFTILRLESYRYKILYGDTDSVFFTKDNITIEDCNKLVAQINLDYNTFAQTLNIEEHTFEIEFEKMFKRIIFSDAKKRYAGILSYLDGKPNNNLIIVGFENKRSDSPQIIRNFQRDLFKLVLEESTRTEVEKFTTDFRRTFHKLREEIGIPCTLTRKLESYKTNAIHVVAAKYSNKKHKTNFDIGSKFKYIYIVNDDKHVVGFDKKLPDEYSIDYSKMEQRLLTNKIKVVFDCLGWSDYNTDYSKQINLLGKF